MNLFKMTEKYKNCTNFSSWTCFVYEIKMEINKIKLKNANFPYGDCKTCV